MRGTKQQKSREQLAAEDEIRTRLENSSAWKNVYVSDRIIREVMRLEKQEKATRTPAS